MPSFTYSRTIHFADTDAAGVVFFARYLFLAHEAYEEALLAAGINLSAYFSARDIIIPVAKSEAAYLRPLACGDQVAVELKPVRLSENTFAIDYTLIRQNPHPKRAAVIRTEHVCLASATRQRTPLPPELATWLDTP